MVEHGADLGELEAEALRTIAAAQSASELHAVRARWLGRKGSISGVLRSLGAMEPAARRRVGAAANAAKGRIEALCAERKRELERAADERLLRDRDLDTSLPGAAPPRGHLHPTTQIERDVVSFFHALGFSVEEGPEVETEYYNFEALNIPADHPARDMQATFFLTDNALLRTHTSPVQIRTMAGRTPPFRFVAPGRVYRHDRSPRHAPMFHQVEGFAVDEAISFGDLKGVLYGLAHHMMGAGVELRFRASYFPFTEPSAEMDFRCTRCAGRGCATCSQSGWLEWGGCGMIHPQVLRNCDIDPERWQGFAFGMGLDRAAMLRFDIPNIHLLFDGDLRVLEQF